MSKFNHSATLKATAQATLARHAAELAALAELFGKDGHKDCQAFWAKQALVAASRSAWYESPAQAKARELAEAKAKIARLEAEVAAELAKAQAKPAPAK